MQFIIHRYAKCHPVPCKTPSCLVKFLFFKIKIQLIQGKRAIHSTGLQHDLRDMNVQLDRSKWGLCWWNKRLTFDSKMLSFYCIQVEVCLKKSISREEKRVTDPLQMKQWENLGDSIRRSMSIPSRKCLNRWN